MHNIFFHITKEENYYSIMKHGLIPKIGERSTRLNENKGIFLFPSIEDMETALYQWLGDEFEEEEKIYALKITLPKDFPLIKTVEFERVSKKLIKPKYISLYTIY